MLTNFAERYSNSYVIAIFACCRQLYNHEKMTGCVEANSLQENVIANPISNSPFILRKVSSDTVFLRLVDNEEAFERQPFDVLDSKSSISSISSTSGPKSRGLFPMITTQIELQNFLLMWGCRPSHQVLANTKMVPDLIQVL